MTDKCPKHVEKGFLCQNLKMTLVDHENPMRQQNGKGHIANLGFVPALGTPKVARVM